MELIGISGKVAKALSCDEGLTALIGNRYFPVVSLQGVCGYPFVTYRNLGVGSDDKNKDAYGDLTGRVEIVVAAQSYENLCQTSGEIQRVMESYKDEIEFAMSNYEEEFDVEINAYIGVITFEYEED